MLEQEFAAKKQAGATQNQVGIISVFIAGLLIFAMGTYIYTGPFKRSQQSRVDLQQAQEELQTFADLKAQEEMRLQNQEALMAQLQERKANFDLFPFVNSVLTEKNLKDRAYLNNAPLGRSHEREWADSVTLVDLKLNGVTLAELIDFLHAIYASNNLVVVYKLEYIRPGSNNRGLECDVTLLAPKPDAGQYGV